MKRNEELFPNFYAQLEMSRNKILNSFNKYSDVTFITSWGNIGDWLIREGTKKLLENINYKQIFVTDVKNHMGETALLIGSGGWCRPFHSWVDYLPIIEERFKHVIVLPSSYDPSVETVKHALSNSKAVFFARELVSYHLIKDICNADLAFDGAFFFDYESYKKEGTGSLFAYRTDIEKKFPNTPLLNNDISLTCHSLEDWLNTISNFETIRTDRAHVMIASAMLGKKVYYRSSSYHKIPGIAEYSLKEFPVFFEI